MDQKFTVGYTTITGQEKEIEVEPTINAAPAEVITA